MGIGYADVIWMIRINCLPSAQKNVTVYFSMLAPFISIIIRLEDVFIYNVLLFAVLFSP